MMSHRTRLCRNACACNAPANAGDREDDCDAHAQEGAKDANHALKWIQDCAEATSPWWQGTAEWKCVLHRSNSAACGHGNVEIWGQSRTSGWSAARRKRLPRV